MSKTPKWALDKAAQAVGYSSWDLFMTKRSELNYLTLATKLAEHIAKYEEPPVSPIAVKARELFCWYSTYSEDMKKEVLAGLHDDFPAIQAIMAALRHPEMQD